MSFSIYLNASCYMHIPLALGAAESRDGMTTKQRSRERAAMFMHTSLEVKRADYTPTDMSTLCWMHVCPAHTKWSILWPLGTGWPDVPFFPGSHNLLSIKGGIGVIALIEVLSHARFTSSVLMKYTRSVLSAHCSNTHTAVQMSIV